ncbi:hypothetical protein ACFWPH_11620 [Nocardia sp. NPDC058499]|uniref:hypothetical protein n=1 Tax=Nocardia sp. NPDC058499 TaxID=3346530 RepID=UPI003665807D
MVGSVDMEGSGILDVFCYSIVEGDGGAADAEGQEGSSDGEGDGDQRVVENSDRRQSG